jgi:hypothetical protein
MVTYWTIFFEGQLCVFRRKDDIICHVQFLAITRKYFQQPSLAHWGYVASILTAPLLHLQGKKGGRRFIDPSKQQLEHYHLVHRSTRDVKQGLPGETQFVLLPSKVGIPLCVACVA